MHATKPLVRSLIRPANTLNFSSIACYYSGERSRSRCIIGSLESFRMIFSKLLNFTLNCERFLNRQRFSNMPRTSLIRSGFSTSFDSIS